MSEAERRDTLDVDALASLPADTWRPDPTTVTVGAVIWCLISAAAFFGSDDLMHQPLYATLAKMKVSNDGLTMIALLDAAALVFSLYPKTATVTRSFIGVISALFWLFMGSQVFGRGIVLHIYPRSGMADFVCGLACGFASFQWPYQAVAEDE